MRMFKPEFQAVIMAGGKGSRIPELSASRPKCLLPIGNKPLVWYPLQMLEKNGFTDVIMVILEAHKLEIQKTLDKADLKIKIDYVCIPASDDLGTADSLRLIADKIASDLIVVSCDFITDFNLNEALDVFRNFSASIVSVFFNTEQLELVPMPGPKTKHKPERDLIGIDLNDNRLIFQASSSDFDDVVTFSRKLLRKHPNTTIFSRLLDCHLYVMQRWVLDYIIHEKTFSTIKGEVIPHIVKKQLTKKPKRPEIDKNQSIIVPETRNDIFQFAQEDELTEKVRQSSGKPFIPGDVIRCYAHMEKKSNFGVRVNTLQSYCLANSIILEQYNQFISSDTLQLVRIHSNADVQTKQIDDRSMVGDGTLISEKTSIKNSFIGLNCVVNNKVRIVNCIIFNNVKISEKCLLQNCIICDGAIIESEVELKDCLVGNNHVIPEGSNNTNEVLTADDKLMEI